MIQQNKSHRNAQNVETQQDMVIIPKLAKREKTDKENVQNVMNMQLFKQ